MKLKHIVIVFTALFIAVFFLGRCSTKKERTSLVEAISSVNDKVTHHIQTIDGLEHKVYEQKQIILSQKDAIKAGLFENKRLKNLNAKRLDRITILKTELLASKVIPLPDTIFITDTLKLEPDKTYLVLPFQNNFTDDYLTLTTWIETNHTWRFDLYSEIDLTITAADKKIRFMKYEPTVFVDTPNPYIRIQDITYVNIQKKKLPWWQQSLITIGVWEAVRFGVKAIVH